MKLVWASGSVRTLPLGASVHGARLDGKQPDSVEFTGAELEQIAGWMEDPVRLKTTTQYLTQLFKACTKM